MIQLRDYQVTAKDKILEWSESDPNIIHTLVSCMGSGKTFIACAAIGALVTQGKKIWICVNRTELVEQWKAELAVAAPNLKSHHRDIGTIAGSGSMQLHRPIQIVMVQTLTRRLDRIQDKHKPDICFFDESHETSFQRVATTLKQKWPGVKQINLTATPVRHGKSNVQYSDLFPKKDWYVVKTAREMIQSGLWKKPIWKSASDELADVTTRRFTGMKVVGGDYDDTSQATVMIDLLPHHLKEWQALRGDKHSCVFFCVNVEHTRQTVAALTALGRKAVAVTGESDPGERKRAIAAYKAGEIDDLVNCQCLTTGFDAPIASCAVWLRKTLSVGLFNQMAGRVLRKFNGVTEALMLDLAGNLGVHMLPEMIDWLDFDPNQKLFRDPKLVLCQNCNYRHDNLPTPIHPTDTKTRWLTGQMIFKDGLEISPRTIISCHCCKQTMYCDPERLKEYGDWLKAIAKSKMSGRKPKPFEHSHAGVSIGVPTETKNTPVTIELLYELGIWKLIAGGEKPDKEIKDRSEEYRELRIKISQNLEQKDLIELRFELLNEKQRSFLTSIHTGKLKEIKNHANRYRAAIAYAYVSNRSPVWAFPYWGDNGAIPKAEISKALTSIWDGSPERFELLEQWIQSFIDTTEDHRKKGICKTFMNVLQSLTTKSTHTIDFPVEVA
jgi:superfamily II DNA or RNA helicase